MKLKVGGQYLSKRGDVWVCYKVDYSNPDHFQAFCIRPSDNRNEYFYVDGRYDEKGLREHCLVKEL